MFELTFEPYFLQHVRIYATVVMLVLAAFGDVTSRRVTPILWIGFFSLGVFLIIFDKYTSYQNILLTTAVVAVLSLLFYKFRILALGDAFGLITTAFLVGSLTFEGNIVSPVTILVNSILLSGMIFPANLVINLISMARGKKIFDGFTLTKKQKFISLFVGHRVDKAWFGFKMEVIKDNIKKLHFSLFHEENDEYCKERDIWVAPSVPFMLFLLIGYVLQMFVGDLILNIFPVKF